MGCQCPRKLDLLGQGYPHPGLNHFARGAPPPTSELSLSYVMTRHEASADTCSMIPAPPTLLQLSNTSLPTAHFPASTHRPQLPTGPSLTLHQQPLRGQLDIRYDSLQRVPSRLYQAGPSRMRLADPSRARRRARRGNKVSTGARHHSHST